MSLRLRYHLMLVSLFAGFALANSALYYFIVRSELSWGLADESTGRALCLASFIGRERRPENPEFQGLFAPGMDRMSAAAQGLTIQWFEETSSGWIRTPLFASADIPAAPLPSPKQEEALRNGEPCSHFVARPEKDSDLRYSFAAVLNPKGGMRAIIAVTQRDSVLRTECRAALRQNLYYCLLVTALGLLVAETLTRIAKRGIFGLEEGARALSKGDYTYRWQHNPIAEINDLGNTLKTISQILQEDVRQAWRRFFQAELLPRQEETAADFQRLCDTPTQKSAFTPRLAIRRINGDCPEDFWGLRADAQGWQLITGRLVPQSPEADTLSQIIRTTAARDYLLGNANCALPELWFKLQHVFPCSLVERRFLTPDSTQIQICTLKAETPVFTNEQTTQRRDVTGTLNAEALAIAQDYVRQNPSQALETVATKLTQILSSNSSGILLVYEPPEGP